MIPGDAFEVTPNGGVHVDEDNDSAHSTAVTRLGRAFARHREREAFADCSRVVVHEGDAGRYEYVDGVHYVTGIDDDARETIEGFVDRRGLTVVMDGRAGFAFEHAHRNLAGDAHVAGVVVAAAFDATVTDLTDVVEVVDGATELCWTEPDGQTA